MQNIFLGPHINYRMRVSQGWGLRCRWEW